MKTFSVLSVLKRTPQLAVWALACPMGMMATSAFAQDKPQAKVDISITNRSDNETLEPGYTVWRVNQGKADSIIVDNIKYVLSCPTEVDYVIRPGWSKSYIQMAENKAKNGRLTFDGIALDPNGYGQFTLRIEGLPVGSHTLQTYHNCWENSSKFYSAPMTVKRNGVVVHENVQYTFDQAVAANACLLTTAFTIANVGDVVELEFSTSESCPGTPSNGQTNAYMAPLCNGFELNTVDISAQAKDPFPASGDMHVDADNKTLTLTWEPANANVTAHHLYWGLDSASVAQMSEPVAKLSAQQTSYQLTDLYSMNTYYWRVDEVDASGVVTEGKMWKFKPRQLAFPGAEGYGRFAQGGRGGVVYHVTNLSNERVPGSFIYGLLDLQGPRTIVFDVSGLIVMDFSSVFSNPNITIAGQTAPGKGICLKNCNINIGSDNICRFMRFKRGYGDTGNAMGITGSDHAIVDHTTCAWGTDETVSGRGAKNVSFQYSIIAEALGIADHKNYDTGTNHGYAATIDGKIGSWHHNLLVHCNGRNWSLGGGMDGTNTAIGQMDIFNNVVYNWNGRTTDGNCHEVNFVGNYYKMGPDTRRTQLFIQQYENVGSPESTWRAYIHGNIRENKNGTLSQDKKGDTYSVQLSNGDPGPTYETVVDAPFFPSYAAIHSATDAFKIVTSEAGASMPMRDDQHLRVVEETIKGTYTYVGSRSGIKGEIDHENDCGGFEVYPEESRAADFDSDQDGMPDWYEQLIGSDSRVANHNDDPDHDGWTLLEGYLEFMSHPYLIVDPNGSASIDVTPYFKGFTKSPVYSFARHSELFTASISGSTITVKPYERGGIGTITMKVTDAEGSTHEKRLSVAVTGDPTALESLREEQYEVAKREFYTLDGKPVVISAMQQHEVYVLKETDTAGKVHTMKVIKQ